MADVTTLNEFVQLCAARMTELMAGLVAANGHFPRALAHGALRARFGSQWKYDTTISVPEAVYAQVKTTANWSNVAGPFNAGVFANGAAHNHALTVFNNVTGPGMSAVIPPLCRNYQHMMGGYEKQRGDNGFSENHPVSNLEFKVDTVRRGFGANAHRPRFSVHLNVHVEEESVESLVGEFLARF